jgi:hypothetical protein
MGLTIKMLAVSDDDIRACLADPGRAGLLFHSAPAASTPEHTFFHSAHGLLEHLRRTAAHGAGLVPVPRVGFALHAETARALFAPGPEPASARDPRLLEIFEHPAGIADDLPRPAELAKRAAESGRGLLFCPFEDL